MKNRILAAALSATLALATLAQAGPISGYPAATTPLSGSETMIGTQSGATVQISAASIAAIVTAATNSWTGVQTFPAPGASKGSIVLTPGTVSGTPANGSLWTTGSGLFAQIGGSAVQFPTLGANTFTGTQTFADGGTWGSGGISGLAGLSLAISHSITDPTASIGLDFVGSGRIDAKTGSTELMQFFNNSGAGEISVNSGGVIGFGSTASPDTAFSRVSAGKLALGNGAALDATGELDAAKLSATTQVVMPGDGIAGAVDKITTTTAHFDAQQAFFGVSAAPGTPGYAGLLVGGAFVTGTAGVIQGGNPSGLYITPQSSYPMGWSLQIFNEVGYQIAGIENGAEDDHSLQLGAVRACTVMYTTCGPSQLLFSDGIWNGAITGFNTLVGGSGYVNGTYIDVPLTGSATGDLGKADITVSGGAVTAVTLHTPARGGFWFHAGDVVSASNANLGGTGSGFSVHVASVSSGASAGPVILMQSPVDFVGFGQASLGADAATSENAIRFGGAGNSGVPWDTTAANQPALTMGGALILGVGLTEEAQLKGNSGGGISVTAPNSATLAPLTAAYWRTTPTTVAALSTLDASPQDGDSAFVTDATAPTFNGTLTGGGSVHTRVHYDGSASAWKPG